MKKILLILVICVHIFAAPQAGDKAIDFTLPSLYNENLEVSLKSYKGNVILLNLWASWCGGCQEEMPHFVNLKNELKNEKFHIILSSIDENPNNAIEFLHAIDPKKVLQSLYDAQKNLPKAYQCMGMPSSYLIDKKGKIVEIFVGSLDKEAMLRLKNKIIILLGK